MTHVLSAGGRAVAVTSSPYTQLREAVSLVTRQMEDLRYDNLADDPSRLDDPYGDRVKSITDSRKAVRLSPLVKVALGLLQHYVLGQGVSVKAQNRALVAKVVDEFMDNTANAALITSHQSQKEFLEALYTDGDFFLVLFPDYDAGTLECGTIDATLVEDSIADPNNGKVTHWYKVRQPSKTFDYATGTWSQTPQGGEFAYYRHYKAEDIPLPTGMTQAMVKPGLVMQVSLDKRGKFGRSQVAIALQWLRAHREFMEDRASINKAAASVAWKKKRKGGAGEIAAEVTRMQSTLVTGPGRMESNPTRATASTIVENEGTSLDWVKTETGGAASDYDERKLRMMAGSALGGIPNHYFGDEGNANLATATAMELPMLKMYEDYQQVLRSVLSDLIQFALQAAHKAGRIGENDLSTRYTEHETTQGGVMEQPPEPILPPGAVATREAFDSSGRPVMPYAPAPQPGLRMLPRPDNMPTTPTNEDDPNAPVSWYVDIDYPPIVQKDLDTYMTALKNLSELLPSETIEGRKLIVELALQTFGVNDIDETMTRLFPPDMVAVQVPAPPPPPVVVPHGAAPFKESEDPLPFESIASLRRRRLIRAADDAAVAMSVVG